MANPGKSQSLSNYDCTRGIQHDVVLAIELLLPQDSINTSMGFPGGALVEHGLVSDL